jgi:hydroxymethylglutaryl-CoA synthase
LAAFGDGCDVFIFKVTEQIARMKDRRGVKRQIAVKQPVPSYEKFLQWRHVLEIQPPARPDAERPAAPALLRDNAGGLALHGSRCLACGTVQYPLQRICVKCGAKDDYEHWPLSRRVGKLFTYCQDDLVFNPNPPTTVIAVDFPDGGRYVGDMADCVTEELSLGIDVEMTFRRVSEAGNNYNYWWKGRPLRY